MRHISIRTAAGFIWLAAAVLNGRSGNFRMTAFFALLGALFLYSAFAAWKRERDAGGGR